MEPIFLKPSYKTVLWGGNNISTVFNRKIEGENIGESWEISAHPNGVSKIESNDFTQENLLGLFNDKTNRKTIFGTRCENMKTFPILAKFIDATKSLSIQVHPNDEYARKYENDSGKNEVWYIMECKENAKLVYGLKEGITKENLENAIDNIEESVNYVSVHKGDFIDIPAGTVHAILDGILLCEVQQSSDITYRVYDWNRLDKNGKPRELHKEKALDVINPYVRNEIHNYENIEKDTGIYRSNKFNIDIVKIEEERKMQSNEESFTGYIVLEGNGEVASDKLSRKIKKGDAFIIPATLGEYIIEGNLKLMQIWI